jgi:hypothetical protein
MTRPPSPLFYLPGWCSRIKRVVKLAPSTADNDSVPVGTDDLSPRQASQSAEKKVNVTVNHSCFRRRSTQLMGLGNSLKRAFALRFTTNPQNKIKTKSESYSYEREYSWTNQTPMPRPKPHTRQPQLPASTRAERLSAVLPPAWLFHSFRCHGSRTVRLYLQPTPANNLFPQLQHSRRLNSYPPSRNLYPPRSRQWPEPRLGHQPEQSPTTLWGSPTKRATS